MASPTRSFKQPKEALATVRAVDYDESSRPEWIPTILRKTRAIPLGLACWIFLILLEILNRYVLHKQGVAIDDQNSVRAIRYLPTFTVVLLSFIWQFVTGALKTIVPWSAMSGKEEDAAGSILLDYVNDLEVLSLFTAARKKHWAIIVGLSSGFFCGALVTLANSLTWINLSTTINEGISLVQTSKFNFDGTLGDANGALYPPWDFLGNKPFAAVTSERLSNGQAAPWTSNGYAFDSLSAGSVSLPQNGSVFGTVNAFSSQFQCAPLRYDVVDHPDTLVSGNRTTYLGTTTRYLTANEEDMEKVGCAIPILQSMDVPLRGRIWSNLTSCHEQATDVRFLTTVSSPSNGTSSAMGVICSPRFSLQRAQVQANLQSGNIEKYDLSDSQLNTFDLRIPTASLWVFLNNPVDPRTQAGYFVKSGSYETDVKPNGTLSGVIASLTHMISEFETDPFSIQLSNGVPDLAAKAYEGNVELLQLDVETLGSQIMAQVASSFARKPAAEKVSGLAYRTMPRLFLRPVTLRAMQVLLAVIGVVCVLLSTVLRPATALENDPGPLAETAKLLAASDVETEKVFLQEHVSSDKQLKSTLKSATCRLGLRDESSSIAIKVTNHPRETYDASGEVERNGSSVDATCHAGWKPFSLRFPAKVATGSLGAGIMLLLAILQHESDILDGICYDNTVSSTALSLLPTAALVLLGYACTGATGSTKAVAPFKSLRKVSNKQPMLWNLGEIYVPFRAGSGKSSIAIISCSILAVLFPIINIVAAGLFTPKEIPYIWGDTVQLDTSLMTKLEAAYDAINTTRYTSGLTGQHSSGQIALGIIVPRASEFSEWMQIPDLGVPERAGVLQNLVFGNVTLIQSSNNLTSKDTKLESRVPALAVDVKCQVILSSDMDVEAKVGYKSNVTFAPKCRTADCQQIVQQSLVLSACGTTPPKFQGVAEIGGTARSNMYKYDASTYNITVVEFDLAAVSAALNGTPITRLNDTTFNPIDSRLLGNSVPNIRTISCKKDISVVDVNATFTRSVKLDLNNTSILLPWSPLSFDPQSIIYRTRLNRTAPDWLSPTSYIMNQYGGGTNVDGVVCSNDTLRPQYGSSTNFFELLAAYAQFNTGNLSSLLDPEGLVNVTTAMYTTYVTQMLTELRPLIHNFSGPAFEARNATFTMARGRVAQDVHTTIALEALIGLALLCLLWIFFRFPSQSILPKSPGSIAARLSFVAGSSLVRRVREEGGSKKQESKIWSQLSSLGWWGREEEVNNSPFRLRWGVDLGSAIQRNWNDPPEAATASTHQAPTSPVNVRTPILSSFD